VRIALAALAALGVACGTNEDTAQQATGLQPSDTAFVRLEGGDFVTALGESVHLEPFEIARNEATCRLYACLASRAHIGLPPEPLYPGLQPYFAGYPDLPAVNMTAIEAESAAGTLGCRLPTAAEWEYAASRGLPAQFATLYPWGSLPPDEMANPANYLAGDEWDTRNMDGYLFLAPAGTFPLSSAGLADLAGNAAEWTRADSGLCRVYGGSWDSPAEQLRIGSWRIYPAGDRARHIGFRLVR
jgi:formylglycine-generating enzyme required for sulfatase activity